MPVRVLVLAVAASSLPSGSSEKVSLALTRAEACTSSRCRYASAVAALARLGRGRDAAASMGGSIMGLAPNKDSCTGSREPERCHYQSAVASLIGVDTGAVAVRAPADVPQSLHQGPAVAGRRLRSVQLAAGTGQPSASAARSRCAAAKDADGCTLKLRLSALLEALAALQSWAPPEELALFVEQLGVEFRTLKPAAALRDIHVTTASRAPGSVGIPSVGERTLRAVQALEQVGWPSRSNVPDVVSGLRALAARQAAGSQRVSGSAHTSEGLGLLARVSSSLGYAWAGFGS